MQTKEKSPKRARGTRFSRSPFIVHIYPALGRSINVTMTINGDSPPGGVFLAFRNRNKLFEIQMMPPFEGRFETEFIGYHPRRDNKFSRTRSS